MLPIEDMLLWRPVSPLAQSARITGKCSGAAPAITAFTATFSTVDSHTSMPTVGRCLPTTSSGERLVPASIASTRSSVGSTIGRKSVQLLSRNSCSSLSSVSGSSSRGVVRSHPLPRRSSSASGRVSRPNTRSMNGPPWTASSPSM